MESAVPTRPVPAAGPESPEPPGRDPGPVSAHLLRRQLRGTGEAGHSESVSPQNFRSVVALKTRLRAAEISRAGFFYGIPFSEKVPAECSRNPRRHTAVLYGSLHFS